MEIHGYCEERFAAVRDVFEKNFSERGDVGASFAATLDGEFVIDIWGGHRDAARSLPWEQDTIVNVYSTTKTMTFICALVLADRGELDFSTRVTHYWPEYGVNGKEKTEVRHIMSHTAGVPGFEPPLSGDQLYDWDFATANLAAQSPWWEPGTKSGYHAITQGFLIGEIVRRITGKTIGTFFKEEIAGPLGADFHIGLDPKDFNRVAEMIPMRQKGGVRTRPNTNTVPGRVFSSAPLGANAVNSAAWRQAEIPAANGHGNARSVVRAQTALANDGTAFGVKLLSASGCRKILEEQSNGRDAVLMLPIRFGMGYAFPNKYMPMSPKDSTAMFWGGAGGSTIIVDLDRRLCFSYVMNQMAGAIVGDSRGGLLGKAVYDAL